MNSVLRSLLREKGRINLLDIGCGEGKGLLLPGELSRRINRFGISASELRTPAQKIAHLAGGVRITIGNAERLTDYYPRNFFDAIVSVQALCHMDQIKVMPQIVDVLMPNGIAMLEYGSDILASRTPRVTDLESYEQGVSFRKTPGL
jgi:SAM-dependent methyltransferase